MSIGHKKSDANSTRTESAGEVLFDRGVYTGINFVVNEVLSMIIAVEWRNAGGKAHFDKTAQWWLKTAKFKDKVIKGVNTPALKRAEDSLEIFALLGGGTALVVPMKMLEDNKQKIVKNLNHLWDRLASKELDADAVKARDEEVDKALACEAKQTWGSMIKGRVVAVLNNMFLVKETIFAGNRTQQSKEWSEKHVRAATKKLHKLTGGKKGAWLERIQETDRYKWYAEIVGLETAYTAISAFVMEMSSKFFARKAPDVKDPKKCEEAQLETAESVIEPVATEVQPKQEAQVPFAERIESKKKEPCKSCASHLERVTTEQVQPAQPSL